ncbi:TodF product hydratase [Aspergillus insuetus]
MGELSGSKNKDVKSCDVTLTNGLDFRQINKDRDIEDFVRNGLDADNALRIQQINSAHAMKNGDWLAGYKLGNITKVMQAVFSLDHLDYGFLHSSLFLYKGISIRRDKFIKPFVELEPAFMLKAPLKGPNVTIMDVINAINYVILAIEAIDSRVKKWAINLPDMLAGNGSTEAVILGGTPRRLTDLTMSGTRDFPKFDGQGVMSGNTKNMLGNPLSATAWLVYRIAKYNIKFVPGQVIMPGSCLEAVPME